MADGITQSALAIAISATVGQALGVDPKHLIWGLFGGLVLLSMQEPMGRWRAVLAVTAAAITAAALTALASVYVQQWFERTPAQALEVAIAFLIGLSSQALLSGWLKELPGAIRAVFERFRGGGRNG